MAAPIGRSEFGTNRASLLSFPAQDRTIDDSPDRQSKGPKVPRWSRRADRILTAQIISDLKAQLAESERTPQELDGRRGHRWLQSAIAYLEWRAGFAWRGHADRMNLDVAVLSYVEAVRLLNSVLQGTHRPDVRSCPCPYCQGSPFADLRKRGPASVTFDQEAVAQC